MVLNPNPKSVCCAEVGCAIRKHAQSPESRARFFKWRRIPKLIMMTGLMQLGFGRVAQKFRIDCFRADFEQTAGGSPYDRTQHKKKARLRAPECSGD